MQPNKNGRSILMLNLFSGRLGIDLGTANTLIYERGRGITLNEPSVVAMKPESREIVAVGAEAKQMLGRTPGDILAIRPLKDGVIADFETTEIMLKYFIRKAVSGSARFMRIAGVVICVPSGITDVEKRAVEEAARRAGARETYLMDEPVAAALGSDLDISEPRGRMVIDIGGGTCEVAVISLNGIVERTSVKVGGDYMDRSIVDYVRQQYNVAIGEATGEYIKKTIGNMEGGDSAMTVRGRSLISGLPAQVEISAEQVKEALTDGVNKIVDAARRTLEKTPPELASDIFNDGIIISGGTSLLKGLDRAISERTGILVRRANDPLLAVAEGAGKAVELLMENRNERFARRIEV